MCVPILTAVAIGGLALSAWGGYQEGKAQEDAAKYSAAVDRNNATLKDQQAEQVSKIGAIEEERHRRKVQQAIGGQRAALAANGLDLSSGTPLDLVTETAALGEEDALNIRFNAAREAWGFREEAKSLRGAAAYKTTAGKNAKNATFLTTTANTVLGAASLKY
jgi:hypothetical protein